MRWLPLSGLGFVACFAASAALYGSGAGSDTAGIVAYYASETNRLRQIGGFAALLVGCVLFLVFVVVLTREVVVPGLPSTIALVSGAGSALLLAVANALWAATALSAEIEAGHRIDPHAHLLVEDAAYAVVVTAMAFAIPLVLATLRSPALPRWVDAIGVLATLGLAAAFWYWPLAAFAAWLAGGSVVLARRPNGALP